MIFVITITVVETSSIYAQQFIYKISTSEKRQIFFNIEVFAVFGALVNIITSNISEITRGQTTHLAFLAVVCILVGCSTCAALGTLVAGNLSSFGQDQTA
jgi:hypothetical protein